MLPHLFILAVCVPGAGAPEGNAQRLEGFVLNGSQGNTPVAGAEVVLRAGVEGPLTPVASCVTDQSGRFVFDNLPVEPGLIYLPGANRHGIHYPGPRLRAAPGTPPSLRLLVFDAVASPSPLVAERHEIDIQVKPGALEISETLVVSNPSLTSYVGEAAGDMPPETLALRIPDEFERVTFASEFHGKNFRLEDRRLVTSLPWPPGKRELKFTYSLHAEGSRSTLERLLDLPTALVRIRVRGEIADHVTCDLPRVPTTDPHTALFESSNTTIAAGHPISIRLGGLPIPWITYARWAALALLTGAILATTAYWARRRSAPTPRLARRPLQSR